MSYELLDFQNLSDNQSTCSWSRFIYCKTFNFRKNILCGNKSTQGAKLNQCRNK